MNVFQKNMLMGTFGNGGGGADRDRGCRNLRNELHSYSLRHILSGLANQGVKPMEKVTSWKT